MVSIDTQSKRSLEVAVPSLRVTRPQGLCRGLLFCVPAGWRLRRHHCACLLKSGVTLRSGGLPWRQELHYPRMEHAFSGVSTRGQAGPWKKMQVWVCISCHHRHSDVPDSTGQGNAYSASNQNVTDCFIMCTAHGPLLGCTASPNTE